jgi:hypothetical protein
LNDTIDNLKDKTFDSEEKLIQLMEDFIFLCTREFERQLAENKRQAEWKAIVRYEENFRKREGLT